MEFLGPVQLWHRMLGHYALVQIYQTKALYMSRLQIILHIDSLQHCIRNRSLWDYLVSSNHLLLYASLHVEFPQLVDGTVSV